MYFLHWSTAQSIALRVLDPAFNPLAIFFSAWDQFSVDVYLLISEFAQVPVLAMATIPFCQENCFFNISRHIFLDVLCTFAVIMAPLLNIPLDEELHSGLLYDPCS